MSHRPHIACLMMVKNEHKRLSVTLDSLKGHINSLIVYDTGSTDDTIDILKKWSEQAKIPLRLKEGTFVDFSTSRNVSLDFADTFLDVDFLLLMDVNDQLQGGEHLQKFVKTELLPENHLYTAYMIKQTWWSGTYDTYFNFRGIKPRASWRYKGAVHEYLVQDKEREEKGYKTKRIPENIVLFQDRTQDDDKSGKRFFRDKQLLLNEFEHNPHEPRTLFYLAQTFSCLEENEMAIYYYFLRTQEIGFYEEVFHSYYRIGILSQKLKKDWHFEVLPWFMKAIEHTPRVEPLLAIAKYYREIKSWSLAYFFSQFACSLSYPTNATLFVDHNMYEYERWHLMGIVAYYVQHYEDGKKACFKAIEVKNLQIDKDNLKFYLDVEQTTQKQLTKSDFILEKIKEYKQSFPSLTQKQLLDKAKRAWKNR